MSKEPKIRQNVMLYKSDVQEYQRRFPGENSLSLTMRNLLRRYLREHEAPKPLGLEIPIE